VPQRNGDCFHPPPRKRGREPCSRSEHGGGGAGLDASSVDAENSSTPAPRPPSAALRAPNGPPAPLSRGGMRRATLQRMNFASYGTVLVMSQNWVITFVILLAATVYCSYVGDDDVVYQYLHRQPTPDEGLRRIRWVLLRTFTSISGGAVLAALVLQLLIGCCSIRFSGYPLDLLLFACIAVVSVLIGILSNGIRRVRGRPTRPLIDKVVWQRSSGPLK
jgi:hypothetical protein